MLLLACVNDAVRDYVLLMMKFNANMIWSIVLQTLKQYNSRLENRTQLVTLSHVRMGPKVFINCAGFIKIDTKALAERLVEY
jgi:transcriptional accessory protein Tex/SPT6